MYRPNKIDIPILKTLCLGAFTKTNNLGITKRYENCTKTYAEIPIDIQEYIVCENAAKTFWANKKKGIYGSGLIATEEDKSKPVRVGLLGQMAFAKFIGDVVDTEYREGGDEYDNIIENKKYDIKCSAYNRSQGLVYALNANGVYQAPTKDYYVFGHLDYEDVNSKRAQVALVGFITKEDLVNKSYVEKSPVRGAKHYNYVVPYNILANIEELR